MFMRTLYYVLRFAFLLLLLSCVNFVRWPIPKSQLALLSVRRWISRWRREWRSEAAMKG
jgi:hypothetical protein